MGLSKNEIRIGNYIEFNGLLCIVETIDEQGATVKIPKTKENEWIDLFQFNHVPLTEEWLIKFGFIFGIKLQDFVKGKHQYVEFGVLQGYFSESGVFYYSRKTQIKSVHQLQNLYFALTGTELTHQKN